jgi:hypothetical protein
MSAQSANTINDLVLQRIFGEFLEMPGLRLSCQQAQRLWGLDEQTCRELLEFLVEARFLNRRANGMYTRIADGRAACPRPRMAKAGLDIVSQSVKQAV